MLNLILIRIQIQFKIGHKSQILYGELFSDKMSNENTYAKPENNSVNNPNTLIEFRKLMLINY